MGTESLPRLDNKEVISLPLPTCLPDIVFELPHLSTIPACARTQGTVGRLDNPPMATFWNPLFVRSWRARRRLIH